jgi:hypothetical protein
VLRSPGDRTDEGQLQDLHEPLPAARHVVHVPVLRAEVPLVEGSGIQRLHRILFVAASILLLPIYECLVYECLIHECLVYECHIYECLVHMPSGLQTPALVVEGWAREAIRRSAAGRENAGELISQKVLIKWFL